MAKTKTTKEARAKNAARVRRWRSRATTLLLSHLLFVSGATDQPEYRRFLVETVVPSCRSPSPWST